jgi:hypothetical protein
VTSDIIKGFNRDTGWLATGVLGPVVFAALVLAVQEYHPTNVNPTGESVQAGSDRSLNANVVIVGSVVAKSSNDKMASGEGSGVDHAFNKASPQDDATSQIEPIAAAPTPVFAFTPELSPNDAVANPDSETSALRQDSARSIRPEARNARNRSSVASRSIGVKRRLILLWHQSLAIIEKSRSRTAFSNLNRGVSKKAAYTPETNR